MRARALLVVAATLALAACGGPPDGEPGPPPRAPERSTTPSRTPSSTPPGTPSVTPQAVAVPGFPAGTARQHVAAGRRSLLLLADVRVARHDGFDRLVVELDGPGVPGWTVGYVPRPRADGSGEQVPVRGRSFLDVYVAGTTYDPDAGEAVHGRVATAGGVIGDVDVVGTFEGDTQVVVGLEGDAVPFRVFRLADPPRVVVDVRDR